jgi:serine/threonine protein kinase
VKAKTVLLFSNIKSYGKALGVKRAKENNLDLMLDSYRIVTYIERNKAALLAEAKESGEPHYFASEDTLGAKIRPMGALVTPEGKIYLNLTDTVEDFKTEFRNLGSGSFKKVVPSLDYELASGKLTQAFEQSPFRAMVEVSLNRHSPTEKNRINSFRKELDFRKKLAEVPQVARIEAILDAGLVKEDDSRVIYVESLYQGDLSNLIHKIAEKKSKGFNGRSLDKVNFTLATDILDGILTLHERGIHHRDIKPGNILIEEASDGKLAARITDFGVFYDTYSKLFRIQVSTFIPVPSMDSQEAPRGKNIAGMQLSNVLRR